MLGGGRLDAPRGQVIPMFRYCLRGNSSSTACNALHLSQVLICGSDLTSGLQVPPTLLGAVSDLFFWTQTILEICDISRNPFRHGHQKIQRICSVENVLPASMWAMIPMLRYRSRRNFVIDCMQQVKLWARATSLVQNYCQNMSAMGLRRSPSSSNVSSMTGPKKLRELSCCKLWIGVPRSWHSYVITMDGMHQRCVYAATLAKQSLCL
jgi:hypothetical protein